MSIFAPTTKADLATAVQAWVSNGSAATTTYGHISTWNVSAITDMSGLCMNKNSFNGDISNWNVSNVTDMSNMFTGVNAFNRGIGIWNVSNVRNMSGMFAGTQYSNMALNAWNVSNVTNMSNMFNGSIRYDQNFRGWSVGPSTILTSMFSGATAMITNQGVSSTPSYTYFNKASTPTYQAITTRAQLDTAITAWIANPVTAAVTYGDINTWDVFTITDMSNLFSGKSTFNSNISGWNVSRVTNMSGMFNGAVAFNQPINSWTVNRVNNMSSMFMNASAFNLNISGWIVGRATLFSDMFSGATAMIANQGAAITPLYTYFTQAPNTLPTGSVTISGTPTQKQVLTISNTLGDLDGLGPFTYQWKRAGTNISGAIGSTYTLVQDDVGFAITVTVSYIDLQGTVESVTSSATATIANANDIATGSVTISGTPIQNQVLTASNTLVDIDGLGPITYQWKRAGSNISGATGSTYTLVQGDVGFAITVTASYTDGFGAAESKTSAATTAVTNGNDSPTGSVTISGTPTQNQVLTASNTLGDLDGLGPITYQWKRGGVAISGATGSTYTLVQGDVGFAITVTASYTDLLGTVESVTSSATAVVANTNDIATGSVTISGTPTQNQVLTVSNTLGDLDGLGPFTYQWKRAGSNISGATGSTYTLVQDDVGFAITVTASYTDLLGSAESVTSSATTAVTNGNDSPTGSVTISGTPTQNQVLTASNTLGDLDGLGPITYQWKRAGSNISGATGSTYTLVQGDVGFAITVTASYTDLLGTVESVTSSATAVVANTNDIATGSVTISGTPTQNQVLTVSNTLGDLDGLGPFTYQWKRAGSNISGATGSTYTLVQGDVGFAITVTASYTDLLGSAESVTSSATALVAMPVIYVFTSKTQLQTAVDAWCSNSITATGVYGVINTWNVSAITDMSNLFSGKASFNSNIGDWNVSQVTNMRSMFDGAYAFNQPLNSWNVSLVTNMEGMFTQAQYFNQPLNSWNVSQVTNMHNLFFDNFRFNQDISNWITSNVTDMRGMFVNAVVFNWNIRGWYVGQATLLYDMFSGATAMLANQGAITTPLYTYFTPVPAPTYLPTATRAQLDAAVAAWNSNPTSSNPYGLINTWDVSAITDMSYLFLGNTSFNSNISDWNVSNVTSMFGMFNTALAFNQPLNDWNVSNVTNMEGMFRRNSVFNQPLNTWNVSQVTSMRLMFFDNFNFNQDISNWIVSNVTDMRGMFENAGVFNRNIRTWSVGQSTLLDTMFSSATAMLANQGAITTPLYTYFSQVPAPTYLPTATREQLDAAVAAWISNPTTAASTYGPINAWDVSAITDMSNLFVFKTTFNSNINGWNVSNVTNMAAMFFVAETFNQPLNSWDVSKVTSMSLMFSSASAFNQNIRMWSVGQSTNLANMFNNANAMIANQGAIITPLYTYFTPANTPPAGSLTITGTPTQNQILTANTSGISDVNGLGAFSYQWKRAGSNISGATGSTYTLVQGDVGFAITVTASYTDLQGTAESITSSATAVVANTNDIATGSVTISGTPMQNQVLTVSHTLGDLDGLGPITYQWKRAGSNISGATGSTYALVLDDVGKYITVTASYTDLLGNAESKTSGSTASIALFVPLPTATRAQLDAAITSWISNPTSSNLYGPINTWDVSAITDMSYLFNYKSTFNSNISSWNVSNVTNMQGMFQGATAFNQPLNAWNVSQVVMMSKMFNNASSFNQPLNDWIVSNAVHMGEMFSRATSFDQSIGGWNVSKVVDMNNMFLGATAFNQPLDSWNVIQLTNASNMFCAATKFNQPLSSWIVSNVTEMGAMFSGATTFDQPLNSWNVSKVKNMTSMFQNNAIFNQPLNSWIVSQVTTMQNMFNGAAAFNQPLNSWNLRQVNNLSGMFAGATSFDQPLNSWNVSNVNNMSNMFLNAPIFNRNIRGWYVGQSTLLTNMFSGATAMLTNQGESVTPLYTYFDQAIQYIPPTGGVLITGIAEQGQLLTVSNTFVDPDGVGTVYYQWIRDGSAILEAINSTWTLAEADVGKQITVTATYVDGLGKTKRSTSVPTAQVTNVNDVPNGDVTISGTPTHNQTLTASHTLTDADGPELLTVNWQWNSSGIAINGATGSTYALTQAEVGKPITVTASYTDGHGTAESKTSVATAPVAFAFTSRSQLDAAVTAWCSGNTVTYGDINTWDVSAITDMSYLFFGKSTFNSNINSWNVSQVTNMGSMFYGTTSFNQPLSSWNVSQVTNMPNMFYGATSFNQPLSSWDVSRVGDMWNMFNRASAFNQPLNSWNVSAVRDMSGMFIFAPAFDQPLNTWNVSNVTNMGSMFLGATAFNQPLSSWDVNQVIYMTSMFYDASAFNQNIRTWSVGQSTNLDNMFSGATAMINNQGASATPTTAYLNQAPTPPAPTPTGPQLEPVAFVLPQLNASYELSQALSIIGDYTAPDAYAFPTITLSMPASQFNDGLFQLELVDSNINTLVNPATEAVYYSEKIIYYADQDKLPELKDTANVLLKDLPVINGAALKPLRQRVTGVDGLGASMIHELAYQLIGVSLMDDQIANGASLKASIDAYLTTSLPSFVRLQLANCNGKTQNIAGASDMTTRANVSRELFMQIVESVVGGVNPVTGTAKSSRLNSLFDGSNLVGGKYGIKFIAGDTLRFSITIAPYSVGGVVQDVDYIVDGVQHAKQEARTVELVISMV